MTDVELAVRRELEALVPMTSRAPDWSDVLERAQSPFAQRRLVLALVAALLALGTAAGVTAALGGFDAWLSGKPGKPAPGAEQQRFEAANGRTWAAFPTGTELRELVRTTIGGKTYVLFGFRSGDTLCLKLRAVSLGHSTDPSCVPASTLAHASSPLAVVTSDFAFEDKHAHPSAEFSFGIVADGVSRVDVKAADGTHEASLGGNAYLWVENEQNTGNRVLDISARAADGKQTTVSLGTTFGEFGGYSPSTGTARGPTQIEARIAHPAIGWVLRKEQRGFSGERLDLNAFKRANMDVADARFVKPDPLSDIVVGIKADYCLFYVEGSGIAEGCSHGEQFFTSGPLNVMTTGGGGVQSQVLAGAAADGVVRLTMFDANGLRIRVPLRDNLFALRVGNGQFPVRVVGYDTKDRVVASAVFGDELRGPSIDPSVFRNVHTVIRAAGPNGATATASLGDVTRGFRCWVVDFSTGQARRGCIEMFPTGPWVTVNLVQPAGRDLFVIGETRAPVETVELHFQDGRVVELRPVERLFVAAIPAAYVTPQRQLAFAVGYDAEHHVVQRQGFVFRSG